MALKGKPVAIGNTATTIYTCPATKEAAVHGLLFGNNTASALAVDVIVYNQATGSDVTVVTDLAVPANGVATWSKPINLNAGDAVKAISSAASGMVCLYSTYEDGATPVASGFTARGVWSSGSTYAANDIVSVTGSGTYVAIQASTNQDPTTETAYWMYLEGISASALPVQAGNAGKYLTTDGTDASWGELDVAGGGTYTDLSADLTLTAASNRVQVMNPTTAGLSVTLPNATSLSEGESFVLIHKGGAYSILIKNYNDEILGALLPTKMYKMYLVNSTTGDWEATAGTIGGSVVSLSTNPSNRDYNTNNAWNSVFQKTGTGAYTFVYGSYYNYRLNAIKFTVNSSNKVTVSYSESADISYPCFEDSHLNGNAFIDTNIIVTRSYSPSDPYPGRVSLIDATASPIVHRHTHDMSSSSSFNRGPIVKVGTRKAFTFGTSFSSTVNTTARWAVLDYSSSLTSPSIGEGSFNVGGSLSPRSSDGDALTDSLVLVGFNVRTGDTTYEKKVIACTISGTSASFGSAVSVATGIGLDHIKIRKLSATKAIVAYPKSDNNYYAKIATLSGTSITLGSEFKIAGFEFGHGFQIIPQNENTMFIAGQYSVDGFRTYMSKLVISGSSFVSASAPSKMSDINGYNNHGAQSNGIYDADDGTVIFAIPSSNTYFIGKALSTEI